MSEDSATIACDACGRHYRWKPQLGGRRVRCKCGETIAVPDQPPPAGASPLEGVLTGLTEPSASPAAAHAATESKCPICNSRVKPGAVICINCGADMRTGRRLETKRSESFITGGRGGSSGALKLVQLGLLMQLGAIALTICALALPIAAIWLGPRMIDYALYAGYTIAALQTLGAILCLATPRESGGRAVLAASIVAGFAAGVFDALLETGTINPGSDDSFAMLAANLLSSLLSIVSTICFLAFFIKLAQFLEFAEVTERAEKVMQLYIGLLLASFAAFIPFIGCFVGLLIIGLAIYAGILYLLLIIDLNKAVAYRIAEAT